MPPFISRFTKTVCLWFSDMTETTQLYIVGTDHNFQTGQGCYKAAAAEFQQYITEICRDLNIRFIGEEMNRDALDKAGVEMSVCEMVANDLGLQHRLCDPDSATRKKLGILNDSDVEMKKFFKNWSRKIAETQIFKERRKREEIWLGHVESVGIFPLLFVCGANHVESFSSLLQSKGLRSDVVAMDWAPVQTVHQT